MHKDQQGNTPAHDAARRSSMPALLVLTERCPSLIYVANAAGLRPIDLAEREEARRFLKDAEKRSMVPAVQLQTLARDNRALAAHNAVLALYARDAWRARPRTAPAAGDAPAALSVPPDGPEHAAMRAEFARTMSKVCPPARARPGPPPQPGPARPAPPQVTDSQRGSGGAAALWRPRPRTPAAVRMGRQARPLPPTPPLTRALRGGLPGEGDGAAAAGAQGAAGPVHGLQVGAEEDPWVERGREGWRLGAGSRGA
jgi:hypothetical protein